MKETLQHYFSVYLKFVSTSIQAESGFRTSYILHIVLEVFFLISSLASVNFIYNHVDHIGPWKREQLLFFVSFVLTIENLHTMIFSQNFWYLSSDIKTGHLDYTLLRPISSIFTVFFRRFFSSSIFSSLLSIFFLIYYGRPLLSLLDWIYLPPLLILGLTLLALIGFCLSTALFWIVEGMGLNVLRMQIQSVARWPAFIYAPLYRKVFTLIVPILLVSYAPVDFLYNKSHWMPPLQLLCAIIVLFFLLLFLWNKGLSRYDSASS